MNIIMITVYWMTKKSVICIVMRGPNVLLYNKVLAHLRLIKGGFSLMEGKRNGMGIAWFIVSLILMG